MTEAETIAAERFAANLTEAQIEAVMVRPERRLWPIGTLAALKRMGLIHGANLTQFGLAVRTTLAHAHKDLNDGQD